MRSYLIFEADPHSGHRLGLCNPETILYDEDEEGNLTPFTPQLTETQKYLWTLQQNAIGQARKIIGKHPALLFFLGDLTHGNKYPQQLLSTRLSDQVIVAANNAKPWYESGIKLDAVRITKGTAAHNLGEGSLEILVAEQLKALYPDVDTQCNYHGLATCDGVGVDYAHHGPSNGLRVWTRENVARFYLRDMIIRHVKRFEMPPKLVVRAHHHGFVHFVEFDEINGVRYPFHFITVPSMCGLSEHAIQVTRSADTITNGVILVEIDGDRITNVVPLIKNLDIRTKESFWSKRDD